MNCNISMQICNNRNTRLGGALGCSPHCPWTGSPVQMLIYVYLHCFESPPMIKSTLSQRLTVRAAWLKLSTGLISCGCGKQTVPFMWGFLHICKFLMWLFLGTNNTEPRVLLIILVLCFHHSFDQYPIINRIRTKVNTFHEGHQHLLWKIWCVFKV